MKVIDVEDMERVADVSDMASNHEQANTERAIDRVLNQKEKVPDEFDGTNCVDCDQEIIQARLDTGAFRCIFCQEKHELKQKQHRSHFDGR